MTDERVQELIQADLDGELGAAARAELARRLLADPEARRLQREMQRTDRLLRDLPAADPPAGLRDSILAGTGTPEPSAPAASRWQRATAYRLAAAVVGGLLIVGVAYYANDGRAPGAELQGSVAAPQDRVSLQAEGFVVDASLGRDGERLRLELDASAMVPGEVVVVFDDPADNVTVPLAAGRHASALEFSGAAPVRLELRANGQLAATAVFPVSGS